MNWREKLFDLMLSNLFYKTRKLDQVLYVEQTPIWSDGVQCRGLAHSHTGFLIVNLDPEACKSPRDVAWVLCHELYHAFNHIKRNPRSVEETAKLRQNLKINIDQEGQAKAKLKKNLEDTEKIQERQATVFADLSLFEWQPIAEHLARTYKE